MFFPKVVFLGSEGTPPKINIAPENGWLENDCFLLGWPIFMLVSGSVHPGRLTWNLQIPHLERKMMFQTSMIVFHVNLQGV